MSPLFPVIIAASLFVAFSAGLYILLRPDLDLVKRFSNRDESSHPHSISVSQTLAGISDWVKPVGMAIPRSQEELSRQQRRLAKAGFRRKDATMVFIGAQVLVTVSTFLAFVLSGQFFQNPILFLVLPFLVGALLPDLWLTWQISSRKERIERGLPDALDLLVICVEGGMGLDQALMRISQELGRVHPDLSDELKFYLAEINAGRSREDALRNLGLRTPVDDLRALTAVLIQTDRFGTSVGDSLRAFSEGMRVKRRQRAEEKAAKLGVKMIPPMVFFIFPSIFVVVLGPSIINLIREMLPLLKGGN